MNQDTDKRTLVAAPVILAFVALAALAAFVPSASAHDCYELVPTTGGCGGCNASTGPHDHRTLVGGVAWCTSGGPNPPPGGGCGSLFATDTDVEAVDLSDGGAFNGDALDGSTGAKAIALRQLCTRGILELQFT